jgi:asparagine synthetase A
VISPAQRNVNFLKEIAGKMWKVWVDAERYAQELFPDLRVKKYPNVPDKLTFLHAGDLLKMYPTRANNAKPPFFRSARPCSSLALAIPG